MVMGPALHVGGSMLGHVLAWHAGLHCRWLGRFGHLVLHRYTRNCDHSERQKQRRCDLAEMSRGFAHRWRYNRESRKNKSGQVLLPQWNDFTSI